MVEMRQRIDRGDQDKEIEETIRVCFYFMIILLCLLRRVESNWFTRLCAISPRTVLGNCRLAFELLGSKTKHS